MFQCIRLVGLAVLLSIGIGSVGNAASFDCNKATTETEIAICSDPELSMLDALMGDLFSEYNMTKNSVQVSEQKRWLTLRDSCEAETFCIKEKYTTRLRQSPYNIRETGMFKIQGPEKKLLPALLATKYLAYNGVFILYSFNKGRTARILWQSPNFDESRGTCYLDKLKYSDEVDFTIEDYTYGDVALKTGDQGRSEEITGAYISAKWVGHGDQSHSVEYDLQTNLMVATSIFIDNCADDSYNQIELITGPFFDKYGQEISHNSEETQFKSLTHICGLSLDTEGRTTLHSYSKQDSSDNLRQLLKSINYLGEINCTDDYGETPLHFAASVGISESVLLLLNAGANPNVINKGGETPLGLALGNPSMAGTAALSELKKLTTIEVTDK